MARSVKLDFSISMNIGARAQFVRLWNIPPNIQSPPLLLGRAFEVLAMQGLVFTSKDMYFLHFYIIVFRICICVSITHSAPRTQPCISRATCFEFLYLAFFFVFWVFFSVFVFHICICITQVPTAGLPGGGKHLACNLISDLLVTHTHPPHHSWLVLGQSFLLRLNEHSMMQILIGCFGCRLWWVWITFNPRLENSTNITSLFV